MTANRALSLALFLATTCQTAWTRAGPDGGSEPQRVGPSVKARGFDPSSWRTSYDWDGDGVKDEVVTTFSGGAHCCYRVGVKFASPPKTIMLPFRLDGGYVYPEDLPSNPERFRIDESGKMTEMILEIETYDGKPGPLNPTWKAKYGVASHRIAVTFAGRKVHVRNL